MKRSSSCSGLGLFVGISLLVLATLLLTASSHREAP